MGLEAIPPASRIEDDDEFLRRYLPGVSPDVVRLRATIMRLNSSRNRHLIRVITILGESGAGKSYLARVIAAHANWIELAGRGEDLGIEAGLKSYIRSSKANFSGTRKAHSPVQPRTHRGFWEERENAIHTSISCSTKSEMLLLCFKPRF
jgi:hypothetical protein